MRIAATIGPASPRRPPPALKIASPQRSPPGQRFRPVIEDGGGPAGVIAARALHRRACVGGRLVEYAVARQRFDECRGIGVLLDLEGVEPGAGEKQELVAQHVARGAQLAAKAVALSQLARLAVCAAVLEGRGYQR